jgi:HPt (histidine-containing phosphotransfer) domain-containing protein
VSDDDVQAAIARWWQRSRPVVLERIGELEGTAEALTAGSVAPERLELARSETHKLVGSLGTFGLPRGSEIARELEQEFESGGRNPELLADLLAQLRAVVEASDS